MKDRVIHLLHGNARGHLKLKTLFVYDSENPKVFKKNNLIKCVIMKKYLQGLSTKVNF